MTTAYPPLDIEIARAGASWVVHVAGELDMGSCPEFTACIFGLAGEDIVVDMAGLTFVDSTGLNALVSAYERTTAAGRSLVPRAPRPQVAKVLEMMGLGQLFTIEA